MHARDRAPGRRGVEPDPPDADAAVRPGRVGLPDRLHPAERAAPVCGCGCGRRPLVPDGGGGRSNGRHFGEG